MPIETRRSRASPALASTGALRTAARMRSASGAAHAAAVAGRVAVVGGWGEDGPVLPLELFSGDPPLPTPGGELSVGRRFHALAAAPDGGLLVIGGRGVAGDLRGCEHVAAGA